MISAFIQRKFAANAQSADSVKEKCFQSFCKCI